MTTPRNKKSPLPPNPFRPIPPETPQAPETPADTEGAVGVEVAPDPISTLDVVPTDEVLDLDDAAMAMQAQRLVKQARHIKARMALDKDALDTIKTTLWRAVGAAPVKDHPLLKISFRPKYVSRKVNYKLLKEAYPEAYAACVTETEPDPTEPGAMYL